MDVQMHYLGGNARRVPMNQQEFDTKFNFLKESRMRHLSFDNNGVFSEINRKSSFQFSKFCGICCNNANKTHRIIREKHQNQSIRCSSVDNRTQQTNVSLHSCLGTRGISTTTVPLCYELNSGINENDNNLLVNNNIGCTKKYFLNYFSLLECLQRYSFQKHFLSDLIAGIALSLHSAAEGFAFAFLAGLPPIYGLYTAFCSAFIYMFFGTSTFSIMGGNILICFMIRNVIERFALPYDNIYLSSISSLTPNEQNFIKNHNFINSNDSFENSNNEKMNFLIENNEKILSITVTLTFLTGFFYGIIYLFRLEFIFSYLSEHVILGFSIGIAFRILFSQFQHILNVNPKLCINKTASISLETQKLNIHSTSYLNCIFWTVYQQFFDQSIVTNNTLSLSVRNIQTMQNYLSPASSASRVGLILPKIAEKPITCILTVWNCFESINLETLIVYILAFIFLIFMKQFINPFLQMKCRFPFSFEFLLLTTTILKQSNIFRFVFPRFTLLDDLFFDGLAIALFSYSLHIRLSYMLKKDLQFNQQFSGIKWNERRELFSFMMINLVSCFVGAHPPADSLRRAQIAIKAGAKSTVINLSLILTLLLIIVWWRIFIHALPFCILSCIIHICINELFSGYSNLNYLWNISRLDFLIFVFSFLSIFLLSNTSYALFASMIFAASTVIIRLQWPSYQLLVNVTGSGAYYAEKAFYGSELDESGVAVMRYESSILFNNISHFKTCVQHVANGIKGQLLNAGIGTRAGSMKSIKSINDGATIVNAAHIAANACKEFSTNRSTLLISGDVVPNYDVLCSSVDQPQMLKILILDFSAVFTIDAVGFNAIKDLFNELSQRKIRLLFASVNATIRMRFKLSGGFEIIAKAMFFPSVHDAVLYSQQLGGIIAPSIHMSVSMNGCRELITLSSTTSNMDVSAFSAACGMPSSFNANNINTIETLSMERPQSGGAISGSVVTIGSNNSLAPNQILPQFSFNTLLANENNGPTLASISNDLNTTVIDVLSMPSSPLSKNKPQTISKLRERHSNS